MNPPCPLLPMIERPSTPADITALGSDRGPAFYDASLRFAQTHWQKQLPSQALLQVNRALACVFSPTEPILSLHPLPYRVAAWLLIHCPKDQFIGNPRRHWQHLATRMVPPHKDLRTWRAWACWYLAKSLLSSTDHPADSKQIREEGVVEPTFDQIASHLRSLSPMEDEATWLATLREFSIPMPAPLADITIETIGLDELPTVQALAHRIWPQVYPGIISTEQIRFMLDQRYNIDLLTADLRTRNACYALIKQASQPVGYIHIQPRTDTADLFLHKLYILPETAGKGLGATALRWVTQQARALNATAIRLVVNKRNQNAIRSYLRFGFAFEKDLITDIGQGFIMDDYQMMLPVAHNATH